MEEGKKRDECVRVCVCMLIENLMERQAVSQEAYYPFPQSLSLSLSIFFLPLSHLQRPYAVVSARVKALVHWRSMQGDCKGRNEEGF